MFSVFTPTPMTDYERVRVRFVKGHWTPPEDIGHGETISLYVKEWQGKLFVLKECRTDPLTDAIMRARALEFERWSSLDVLAGLRGTP